MKLRQPPLHSEPELGAGVAAGGLLLLLAALALLLAVVLLLLHAVSLAVLAVGA